MNGCHTERISAPPGTKTPQSEGFRRNYEERVPMKRMGNQEEMVGAVIYLGSTAASYTTGQNLVIDGGMTCW